MEIFRRNDARAFSTIDRNAQQMEKTDQAQLWKQRQRQVLALAERVAEQLPLHDPFSPLTQLRGYLRQYLHPLATMADAARLLCIYGLSAENDAKNLCFPNELLKNLLIWAKTQVNDWPLEIFPPMPQTPHPLMTSLLRGYGTLRAKKAIPAIQIPFLAEISWLEAVREAFPKAEIACASPFAALASQMPECFWAQALLQPQANSRQSDIFEQQGAWENVWEALQKPNQLTIASLLDFPTERFERGRGRLFEPFEEDLADQFASQWAQEARKQLPNRMLHFLLQRAAPGQELLLLAPEALWKEAAHDGARRAMANCASEIFLWKLPEAAGICGLLVKIKEKASENVAIRAEGSALEVRDGEWIAPDFPQGTRLGLEYAGNVGAFFSHCFEVKPWETPETWPSETRVWQAAPFLACEMPCPDPAWHEWLRTCADFPAQQPNEYVCVGMKPYTVWATDAPPLPYLLPCERLWIFPKYFYKDGKKRSNLSTAAVKDLAKQLAKAHPIPKGLPAEKLLSLCEEMERFARQLPVLQKFINRMKEIGEAHATDLPADAFGNVREIAGQFQAKIQQLYPTANERRTLFDRLMQVLAQLLAQLSNTEQAIADAQAKQSVATPDGLWHILYAQLHALPQTEQMADWLQWQLPIVSLPNEDIWQMHELGKELFVKHLGSTNIENFTLPNERWEGLAHWDLPTLCQRLSSADFEQLPETAKLANKPLPKWIWEVAKRLHRKELPLSFGEAPGMAVLRAFNQKL